LLPQNIRYHNCASLLQNKPYNLIHRCCLLINPVNWVYLD